MSEAPLLEAVDVCKAYGPVPVLADVSLAVSPGEILVVTGDNGTGKSTLLRCLAGWDRFDSGQVSFDGGDWDPAAAAFRAAVAAELGPGDQFLDLTVREHLEFVARAHGNADPGRLIADVLGEMRLTGVADRFPGALSQGQRRRLALAACWVRPRRLVILDEPEQNLDVSGRSWLAGRLLAERDAGVAIVIACHDPALTEQIADWELELELLPDGDRP